MAEPGGNGNAQQAVMARDVEALGEQLDRIETKLDKLGERVACVEKDSAVLQARLGIVATLNGLGAIAAGIVGVFVQRP